MTTCDNYGLILESILILKEQPQKMKTFGVVLLIYIISSSYFDGKTSSNALGYSNSYVVCHALAFAFLLGSPWTMYLSNSLILQS